MSDVSTVFEFIQNMIVEIKDLEPSEIQQETSIDELGLDSLDYVEIQVGVKREFGVALSPALFEKQIHTLGQLCTYIGAAAATQEA